jgi:arginine utilization protein RocB
MLGRENLKDCIVKAIASYQDEILDFTRSLVRIPTENPPGRSYKACVEAIAGKLREIGLEPTILEVPEADGQGLDGAEDSENLYPRYCLLTSYGKGTETLYFHGHYDVVPAANKAQFRSYVEDGRLFGRGAADMKSGLAAMIYAVKAIMACDVDLKGHGGCAGGRLSRRGRPVGRGRHRRDRRGADERSDLERKSRDDYAAYHGQRQACPCVHSL